jgi:hypothetical protein
VRAFDIDARSASGKRLGNELGSFRHGGAYRLPLQVHGEGISITAGNWRSIANFNWDAWTALETQTRSVRVHWGDDGIVHF